MAIYHLNASVVSRARGQRVVASAASRSGTQLHDRYYAVTHNFSRSSGVTHCEILAPPALPDWVFDRESLWNRVEAGELRKDSQLARAVEVGLPLELTEPQSVALVRDFVRQEFVAHGMIADISIRRSNPRNPIAQVLLTLRPATATGFGPKARHWNRKSNLIDWRRAWAELANLHLARAGHAVRIDHRTLEAQQIELTPGRRVGLGPAGLRSAVVADHLQARVAEQARIMGENGNAILDDPSLALRALTAQRMTFTRSDIQRFLQSRTSGAEQCEAALAAIMACPELVSTPAMDDEQPQFTSRDMVDAERSLRNRVAVMTSRRSRGASLDPVNAIDLEGDIMTVDQRRVLRALVADRAFSAVSLPLADSSSLFRAALLYWSARGSRVTSVAVSPRSQSAFESSSGVTPLLLAQCEPQWLTAAGALLPTDVVLVAGAEMIALKPLERLVGMIDKVRAKLVLIGDGEGLRAMGRNSPLFSIIERHPA